MRISVAAVGRSSCGRAEDHAAAHHLVELAVDQADFAGRRHPSLRDQIVRVKIALVRSSLQIRLVHAEIDCDAVAVGDPAAERDGGRLPLLECQFVRKGDDHVAGDRRRLHAASDACRWRSTAARDRWCLHPAGSAGCVPLPPLSRDNRRRARRAPAVARRPGRQPFPTRRASSVGVRRGGRSARSSCPPSSPA